MEEIINKLINHIHSVSPFGRYRRRQLPLLWRGLGEAVLLLLIALPSFSQPAARRREAEQKKTQTNANNITERSKIYYPVAETMPEDVVWRRDIYRELKLTDDANAGLYYPVEPQGSKVNLFTYIFKLFMRGLVPVYEYRLDGNESFDAASKLKPMDFLKNYHIYYESQNGRVHIDNSDIPSKEVTGYYIKESSYFNNANSSFHTQVLALCPIMEREDDFGDGATKYPLFWVRYSDLAPYLARQTVMTSSLNNAAVMTLDDYFTLNCYRGKIYKTNNMLGRTLAQYCPTDSAMLKEQKRIEKELSDFEKNIYGDRAKKDSLDSIANAKANTKASKKKARSARRSGTSVRSRRSKSSSVSTGSAARVTVRRERH